MLHDFWDCCKESISHSVKTNLSIEYDHTYVLLWRSLCARFHKLKELEEKTRVLQIYEKIISHLKEEIRVDDYEALVVLFSYISCNYSVLSEQDVQNTMI